MADMLREGPIARGDVASHLESVHDKDDHLSRTQLTEFWNEDKETRPDAHRA